MKTITPSKFAAQTFELNLAMPVPSELIPIEIFGTEHTEELVTKSIKLIDYIYKNILIDGLDITDIIAVPSLYTMIKDLTKSIDEVKLEFTDLHNDELQELIEYLYTEADKLFKLTDESNDVNAIELCIDELFDLIESVRHLIKADNVKANIVELFDSIVNILSTFSEAEEEFKSLSSKEIAQVVQFLLLKIFGEFNFID